MGTVTLRYKYKNYPQAPSLTKKSDFIGRVTHPFISFGIGMLLAMLFGDMRYTAMFLTVPGMLILMPIIRNALFKKLDEQYADMLAGKIPME